MRTQVQICKANDMTSKKKTAVSSRLQCGLFSTHAESEQHMIQQKLTRLFVALCQGYSYTL